MKERRRERKKKKRKEKKEKEIRIINRKKEGMMGGMEGGSESHSLKRCGSLAVSDNSP